MRITPVAIAGAVILATMASAGHSQKPDDQIDARSMEWLNKGKGLVASGQYDPAIDALETALVLDPKNRSAYVTLASVARAQKLPGKAIQYYGEALAIEPNDANALAGQGEALVERGAVDRARQNLERLRTVCKNPCPQATQLSAVIAKGPPAATVAARPPSPAAAPKN